MLIYISILISLFSSQPKPSYVPYNMHTASPEKIQFFYKNNGSQIRTLDKLSTIKPGLKWAFNASMFQMDYSPCGLYVENGKIINKMTICNGGKVNFCMQPQGVFAITKSNKAIIVPVDQARVSDYKYAVQCAPMVVIDSKINPRLTKSNSKFIRNGYGILKNGSVLFLISKKKVTFQEFAQFFIDKGCTEAVFIDGGVSEHWTPERPSYREFGVLVGSF